MRGTRVLAVVLLVAAACGGDDGGLLPIATESSSTGQSTSAPPTAISGSTTPTDAPATAPPATAAPGTAAPGTAAPEPSSPDVSPATTEAPVVPIPVDGAATNLAAPPEDATPEATGPEEGLCSRIAEVVAGPTRFDEQECLPWENVGGLMVTAEIRSVGGRTTLSIWARPAPDTWQLVLGLEEPAVGAWEHDELGLNPMYDLDGDGSNEVISVVRSSGSGGYLTVDVIDLEGGSVHAVATLADLPQGALSFSPSDELLVQQAVFAEGDPECCPSATSLSRLYFEGGRWWLGPAVDVTGP